jgi:hypothetical protein
VEVPGLPYAVSQLISRDSTDMRYSALPLAILLGSGLSIAQAQFSAALPGNASGSAGICAGGSDSCATPDPIAGSGSFAFDSSAATTGTEGQNENLCKFSSYTAIENDIWFEWTADFTGTCEVDTCNGTIVDTKIAAYPGGGCPVDGSSIGCSDDTCGFQSRTTFPVTSGLTYLIQVGSYKNTPGGTGTLKIGSETPPPCPVMHDGASENAIGLTLGGDMGWMTYVDCLQTIDIIEVAYGSLAAPGYIATGSPVTLGIWDDPSNDGNPFDAVLLTTIVVPAGVTLEDTDQLNIYNTGSITVTGGTFVGVVCTHLAGEKPASLDQTHDGYSRNWLMGSSAGSGTFDFVNLYSNDIPPVDTDIVFAGNYLISVTGTPVGGEPGVGYCFGDPGSGTPCPCSNDNDGSVPGSGCDNGAFASGAKLTGSGVASLSNDSLVLTTHRLEPNNSGLYFQADNDLSPGVIWGDGLQCAGGDLRRLQVRFANAMGTSSTTLPISAKAGNVTAGSTKRYQCWYRTTSNPPCGSGVNDFNASNGYEVTWLP